MAEPEFRALETAAPLMVNAHRIRALCAAHPKRGWLSTIRRDAP